MIKIPRCYDSHLHLIPTGELSTQLNLRDLASPEALKNMAWPPHAERGSWLIGFGWDATTWSEKPHREILDRLFPHHLTAFSRKDGHALWLNTEALKAAGLWRTKNEFSDPIAEYVEFDPSGRPSGLVFDRALEKVMNTIPPASPEHMRASTEAGVALLRREGFTHLREMMADEPSWKAFHDLARENKLGCYLEVNFHCSDPSKLDETLALYRRAQREETSHLRPAGIKIFIDGAMGSEGALLSKAYEGKQKQGFQLWSDEDFAAALQTCWSVGAPVAVHCIGDQAVKIALRSAQQVSSRGVSGLLHLEHLQMLSPEDASLFKNLSVYCHLQPSHFLADASWLKEKLGERWSWTFPWSRLEKMGLPLFFGSDTPVESPGLKSTHLALQKAREFGFPALQMDWTYPHSHPEKNWGSKCWTEINSEAEVTAVFFDGQRVI